MRMSLKIIIILLAIALIGGLIYTIFFQERPTPPSLGGVGVSPEETTKEPSKNALADVAGPVGESNLRSLAIGAVLDYWINKKTGEFYYLGDDGSVSKINGSLAEIESTSVINSQTLPNLRQLLPAPDGTAALAEFNYPEATTFSVFETETGNWQPLPSKIISAAWSPDSQEITYLDDRGIKIWNRNTKKSRELIGLSQKDLNLGWLTKNQMLISDPPSVDHTGSIWSLNPNTKTLSLIMEQKNGLMSEWSQDGSQGMLFYKSGIKDLTTLIDNRGATLRTFAFTTLPSKCYLETSKIYCAVPRVIPPLAILPDDYLKRKIYFEDGIYLIDLAKETLTPLLETLTPIDAEHLEVYQDTLIFKNRLDDRVYTLRLQ